MENNPLRILIVDDNADTARMMQLLLTYEGYESLTAYDGPRAVEAAREFLPDVVLLDLTLPHMSGIEVAHKLKVDPEIADCVLVAVSGYDMEAIETAPLFHHRFQKPVDHDILIKLLRRLQSSKK
jgi:CheY-like chemotaxis protein